MKKIILMLLVAFTATLITNCKTRMTDFTIISSKNIDLSNVAKFKRGKQRATGEDLVIVIFFPFGVPNLKEAIDRAIESVPGAVALVDGAIYVTQPILIGSLGYTAEGTPLIDPKLANANDLKLKSTNIVSIYNAETKSVENYFLSDSSMVSFKIATKERDDEAMKYILENESL